MKILVLASLAFDNDEYEENMCIKEDGKIPRFYEDYVKEVQKIIEHNADLEFEVIWNEHKRSGTPRSILSDKLSLAIVELREELQSSRLWKNETLRRVVLEEALPKVLLEKLGLEKMQQCIPESYLRAIFSSYLVSTLPSPP